MDAVQGVLFTYLLTSLCAETVTARNQKQKPGLLLLRGGTFPDIPDNHILNYTPKPFNDTYSNPDKTVVARKKAPSSIFKINPHEPVYIPIEELTKNLHPRDPGSHIETEDSITNVTTTTSTTTTTTNAPLTKDQIYKILSMHHKKNTHKDPVPRGEAGRKDLQATETQVNKHQSNEELLEKLDITDPHRILRFDGVTVVLFNSTDEHR